MIKELIFESQEAMDAYFGDAKQSGVVGIVKGDQVYVRFHTNPEDGVNETIPNYVPDSPFGPTPSPTPTFKKYFAYCSVDDFVPENTDEPEQWGMLLPKGLGIGYDYTVNLGDIITLYVDDNGLTLRDSEAATIKVVEPYREIVIDDWSYYVFKHEDISDLLTWAQVRRYFVTPSGVDHDYVGVCYNIDEEDGKPEIPETITKLISTLSQADYDVFEQYTISQNNWYVGMLGEVSCDFDMVVNGSTFSITKMSVTGGGGSDYYLNFWPAEGHPVLQIPHFYITNDYPVFPCYYLDDTGAVTCFFDYTDGFEHLKSMFADNTNDCFIEVNAHYDSGSMSTTLLKPAEIQEDETYASGNNCTLYVCFPYDYEWSEDEKADFGIGYDEFVSINGTYYYMNYFYRRNGGWYFIQNTDEPPIKDGLLYSIEAN